MKATAKVSRFDPERAVLPRMERNVTGSITNLDALLTKLKRWPAKPIKILALDPGETTGWAIGEVYGDDIYTLVIKSDQWMTSSIEASAILLDSLFKRDHIDLVVCEDYRVYSWKSDTHKWANLHTPKLIGCIQAVCALHSMPRPIMQMAIQAKDFCTDEKLQDWDLYTSGKPHARDAVRHLCSYLIFDKGLPEKFT